eukprot:10484361-Karenia_brevis.AAC.1
MLSALCVARDINMGQLSESSSCLLVGNICLSILRLVVVSKRSWPRLSVQVAEAYSALGETTTSNNLTRALALKLRQHNSSRYFVNEAQAATNRFASSTFIASMMQSLHPKYFSCFVGSKIVTRSPLISRCRSPAAK